MPENFRDKNYVLDLQKRAKKISLSFELENNPEDLWPYLSDVNLTDEMIGADAAKTIQIIPTREGVTEVRMLSLPFGYYEEMPYEWSVNQYWMLERIIRHGPVKYVNFSLNLSRENNKTVALLTIDYLAKWYIKLVFPIMAKMMLNKAKTFYLAVDKYTTLRKSGHPDFRVLLEKPINHKNDHIDILAQKLQDIDIPPNYAKAFSAYIFTAPDSAIAQIRPLVLAETYRLDTSTCIKYLLMMVDHGILKLEWNVICPNCNGPALTYTKLSEINDKAHCDSCNIHFTNQFANDIEITFQPTKAILSINKKLYCYGDPARTPNVAAQYRIMANEKREVTINLPIGFYTLRAPQLKNVITVEIAESGTSIIAIDLQSDYEAPLVLKKGGAILFINNYGEWETVKFIIQNRNFYALTADQLFTLQSYRDICGFEAMRPGLSLEVKRTTILFSDIVNSVQLYEEYGDSKALSIIEDHFYLAAKIIEAHHGGIVKTVGDEVMAVFTNPLDALLAQEALHKQKISLPTENRSLEIKIAIHEGTCLLLNINNNMDYFGKVVNIASRLLSSASANETVVSQTVLANPSCQAYMSAHPDIIEGTSKTLYKGCKQHIACTKLSIVENS